MSRRVLASLFCAVLAAAAVVVAAERSGGGEAQRAAGPVCASPRHPIARPGAVPENLLPPGTALTSSTQVGPGRTLVVGVIPREFRRAVEFYVTALPAAGYVNGKGDAEMDEAEAAFVGKSLTGKWKVNAIPNCLDAAALALLVIR